MTSMCARPSSANIWAVRRQTMTTAMATSRAIQCTHGPRKNPLSSSRKPIASCGTTSTLRPATCRARENSSTPNTIAVAANSTNSHFTKISEATTITPIATPMSVATMRSRPVRCFRRSLA